MAEGNVESIEELQLPPRALPELLRRRPRCSDCGTSMSALCSLFLRILKTEMLAEQAWWAKDENFTQSV